MTYDWLKFFHIIGAGLLLSSLGYSYYLWKEIDTRRYPAILFERIQQQTWLVIAPLAIIQLASGFTMISLKHYAFHKLWVKGSIFSFLLVLMSWFSFIYFLFCSQRISIATKHSSAKYKKAQLHALLVFKVALVAMIFFMSTKIDTLY